MRLFTLSLSCKREFRIGQLRYIVQSLTATYFPDCSKWKESLEFGTKMHYRGGEFKLIRSHLKIDVRPDLFQGGFSFSVHVFACEDAK